MQLIGKICSTICAAFIFLAIGVFLVCGVICLALGDLMRFLGRRFTARLRGERIQPNHGKTYSHPHMVMDSDGFVEPPSSPASSFSPSYVRPAGPVVSSGRALVAYRPNQAGFVSGMHAFLMQQPAVRYTLLQFPTDPAVRQRIKARSRRKPYVVAGGDKVIYLSRFLPSKKG